MSQTKIMSELDSLLRENASKYFIDGALNKALVIEDLHNYEPGLIKLLSESEIVKKHFFLEINGNKIIKTNELIEIFEMNEYWDDSYTAYENKIGLTSNSKFLSDTSDVVLDFPYRDTVLKASMSKEEREKEDLLPEEPFLNEKIARDELDILLDKKILINTKKYDEEGFHEGISVFEEDNLIIKGNNLLALYTLRSRYAEKIKLIYIDPPYNTGNDSFNYNDRFQRTSWLTFMKNRIEVAKELLTNDGVIFIQCDDSEHAYLKVLMDEIFGEQNFISNVVYRRRKSQANLSKNISPIHDYILIYGKSNQTLLNNILVEINDSNYKNPDNDPRGPYVTMPTTNKGGSRYRIKTPAGNIIEDEWRFKKETFEELLNDNRIVFPKEGKGKPRYKQFLRDKKAQGVVANTWWGDIPTNQDANREITRLFNSSIFSYPKAEGLIKRIIELGSNEDDIVLDFFMGSGTTPAVAHKIKRRYIGIEQMDYINTVSVPRLQKVIEGEQGGISKDVDWQGGGSFIYAELMEKNTGYLKDVLEAESTDRLREIFNVMLKYADFDFRVDLEEVKESVWRLPLEDQKRALIRIIDKNQLYYNYSEIDDENVRDLISDSDYAFNKSFYDNTGDQHE